MPDPVPVLVLARLAVDVLLQNNKVGGALLRDALMRASLISKNVGVRALIVHAIDDQAKSFYQHYGFVASTVEPMTLMIRLKTHHS
jgi:predicted N-acetyltransferase YhbS